MELKIEVRLGVTDQLGALIRDAMVTLMLLRFPPAAHIVEPAMSSSSASPGSASPPSSSRGAEEPFAAAPNSGAADGQMRPVATPPAPPAAVMGASGRSASLIWTEERIEYLRVAYPRGDMASAIFEALNKLPGERIRTVHAVKVRAGFLGVRRDAGCKPAKDRPVPFSKFGGLQHVVPEPPANPAVPSPVVPADEPLPGEVLPAIYVDWVAIMRWAQAHGVDTIDGDDDAVLDRVNFARRNRNLAPFGNADTESLAA